MAEIKTKKTNESALAFVKKVPDAEKRNDGLTLLKLFEKVTREKPRMWGASMIGFGSYHYKSERSSQEGDWPLTAFSPRKQNLTLYLMPGFKEYGDLLKSLGKHKISGGSCLYINKLSDVDMKVLEKLIKRSFTDMKKKHKQ